MREAALKSLRYVVCHAIDTDGGRGRQGDGGLYAIVVAIDLDAAGFVACGGGCEAAAKEMEVAANLEAHGAFAVAGTVYVCVYVIAAGGQHDSGRHSGGVDIGVGAYVHAFGSVAGGIDGDVAAGDGESGIAFDAVAIVAVDADIHKAAVYQYLAVELIGVIFGDIHLQAIAADAVPDIERTAALVEVLGDMQTIGGGGQDVDGAGGALQQGIFAALVGVLGIAGDIECAVPVKFGMSFYVEAGVLCAVGIVCKRVYGAIL